MNTIGSKIKELRIENRITQPQLAKTIDVSNGTISFWENGKAMPSIDACIKLTKVFHCTLDELVGLSDNETIEHQQNTTSPTKIAPNTIAFAKEFSDIFTDKNYIDMSKLYKAVKPELRALMLGYIVGILQSQGVNTKSILGY